MHKMNKAYAVRHRLDYAFVILQDDLGAVCHLPGLSRLGGKVPISVRRQHLRGRHSRYKAKINSLPLF